MKKIFTILILSCLAMTAHSAIIDSGYCGGEGDGTNLTWEFSDDGTLTISGEGEMGEYIGWSAYKQDILRVEILDGVTSICDNAFSFCSSLTSIEIPESITSIGRWAFSNCSSLMSVEIPESVTSIEYSAFWGCGLLESIEIPDGVTSIGDYAFAECASLTSIEIPESITSIGRWAFSNCSSLMSVEIPESVTSIGEGAFSGCSSLSSINVSENNPAYCSIDGVVFSKDKKELVIHPAGKENVYKIPESVTIISNYAFYGCSLLTSIEIPESVTDIGKYAFYYCSSLTSIEIPESVTDIWENTFSYCSSLESVEIPSGIASIGYCAFYYCNSLTSIEIPQSVTSIGLIAFSYCSSLSSINVSENNEIYSSIDGVLFSKDKKELVSYPAGKGNVYDIPDGVTSIGDGAFSGCSLLTSTEIPESVTSIGDVAFSFCSSLTSIEIPGNVTSIGVEAFTCCSSLKSIISKNPTPPSCGGLLYFADVDSDIPVYVPAESIDLYRNAKGWDYFTNFLPLEELGGDEPGGSAVEETEADGIALKITARDGRIYCEEEFRIVNLAGQDVTAMNGELQGTYIVVSGGDAVKVVVD